MAEASYERQHLAVHAAGFINAAGTTQITFGCLMTKLNTGHYGLLLDVNSGLIDDESFTFPQTKGAAVLLPVVEDVSNRDKRIRVFDQAGSFVDSDIEVKVFKSVTR